MKMCDVSVVIPTFNRASLLQRALNSIAKQTVQPSEVIVIDDCSEPTIFQDVLKIVSNYSERFNIRLIINDKNRGANHSRNKGIWAATTRYIAFLDSDDLWFPEKLEQQTEAIRKAVAVSGMPVLSATGRYRVDDKGEIIARQFGGHVFDGERIRKSNFIGTLSSIVVDAGIARLVGGFDETLPASQDWDFFIRLSQHVQYVGIAEPLCVYVDHNRDRITLDYRKKLRGHLAIYRNHVRASSDHKTTKAEFLRNIAEDYQELGNEAKAAAFYSRALAYTTQLNQSAQGLLEWLLNAFFRAFSTPRLKRRRYRRYHRALTQLTRNKLNRAVIDRDRCIIRQLMAC